VGEGDDHLGGAERADHAPVGQPGSEVVDDALQVGAVGFERAAALADRDRESALTERGLLRPPFVPPAEIRRFRRG